MSDIPVPPESFVSKQTEFIDKIIISEEISENDRVYAKEMIDLLNICNWQQYGDVLAVMKLFFAIARKLNKNEVGALHTFKHHVMNMVEFHRKHYVRLLAI
jgi:hypothetical protein